MCGVGCAVAITEYHRRMTKTILYQNVRGLRTKTNEFFLSILANNYSIVAIVETWLNAEINSNELFDSRYITFRKDRVEKATGHSRGGGVLFAVKNDIQAERVTSLELPGTDCEHMWIRCLIDNRITYLGVFYFPPNTSKDEYKTISESIITLAMSGNTLLILGDFNIRSFDYDGFKNEGIVQDSRSLKLYDLIDIAGLSSLNTVFNHQKKLLDLVFSNLPEVSVSREESLVDHVDVYHPPLLISFTAHHKYTPQENNRPEAETRKTEFLNYSRADFLTMYNELKSFNWTAFYQITDVNEAAQFFQCTMENIIRKTVPTKRVSKSKNKYPPWFTKEIIHALKHKEKFRMKTKMKASTFFQDKYKYYRKLSKKLIKKAYENNVKYKENRLHSDPRTFWTFINEQRKSSMHQSIMKYEGENFSTPHQIAKTFATHFFSVFDNIPLGHVDSPCLGCDSTHITVKSISFKEVEAAIRKMRPKRCLGPDNVPPYIYKGCYRFLVQPLVYLFNLVISNSTFPDLWKISKVVPIPKGDIASDIANYRPIALLPVPAKIFESVLFKRISYQTNHIISPQQHGFMKGRNVQTNLLELIEDIHEVFNNREQADVIYTDFQKAFDKVNHDIMVNKLEAIGFSKPLVALFQSYLTGRKQYVAYKNSYSLPYDCSSGVPQGSNLGPYLFLLYINDITTVIKQSKILLYADDIKIYRRIQTISDTYGLQEDLNSLVRWSEENRLPLNIGKCAKITFTHKKQPIVNDYLVKSTPLNNVDQIRDLGVILDSNLTYRNQILSVMSKVKRNMGVVMRNSKYFKDTDTLKILYYSLIRSHLDFAVNVWDPITVYQKKLVEKIQKRFLRFLYYKDFQYYDHTLKYEELVRGYQLTSLENRRQCASLLWLHDLIHGKIDAPSLLKLVNIHIPPRNSRKKDLFTPYSSRTVCSWNAPLNRCMILYNKIQNENPQVDILNENRINFEWQVTQILAQQVK